MTRVVMHLDKDAFLAAIEQLCYREYRGRPVVVGGRGIRHTGAWSGRHPARCAGLVEPMVIERTPKTIGRKTTFQGDRIDEFGLPDVSTGFSTRSSRVCTLEA